MGSKVAAKSDSKTTALIEVGMDLMLQKGYSNTGLQEILQALNVSKSCFYHYFGSKEKFAVEIIHHFDEHYATRVFATLVNPERSPLQRLRDYCESSKEVLESQACRHGCLIGNLSQEMSDQSEILRQELAIVLKRWREKFAQCIQEGQELGEIKNNRSAHDLAGFFSSAWNGAYMQAKSTKCVEALDIFMTLMFEDILKS